jgi:UDP-GlcNAc:undecaprenyl-phosphate/decaprenyl-phosphate GlcNAc-1-phosphate transferase
MDIIDLIFAFLWAFLISIFAIPSIISVAHTKRLLNEPNHRTIHQLNTPSLGGIAIFAGFATGVTIFGEFAGGVQYLVAGCLIIFFMGVKDDMVTVTAIKKLFIQIVPACIIMIMGDVRVTSFQGLFGIYDLHIGVSFLFTLFVIIGITNAVNLIDGLDGLAGTIVMIISAIFGIYFYHYDMPYAFVAVSLIGGVIGFLRFNMHKAKIFMGDSGSLLCGFIVSIMAIRFIEVKQVNSSPAIAIAVLIIPIFDIIRVFAIRLMQGKNPFDPDKNHLHHRLLVLGLSQLQVVMVLALLNLFVIGMVVLLADLGNLMLMLLMAGFAFIFNLVLELLIKKLIKNG